MKSSKNPESARTEIPALGFAISRTPSADRHAGRGGTRYRPSADPRIAEARGPAHHGRGSGPRTATRAGPGGSTRDNLPTTLRVQAPRVDVGLPAIASTVTCDVRHARILGVDRPAMDAGTAATARPTRAVLCLVSGIARQVAGSLRNQRDTYRRRLQG